MTWPSRLGGRQAQGGFALITALAVIALTGVMIGALFGLIYTTIRAPPTPRREADREGRDADGAIETAMDQMRTEPCSPTTPT